jgi:hypothetical protein
MVYDFYSVRIGAAQQNIAVLTRILDNAWDDTDLFEFDVFLRVQARKQRNERLSFLERVRTHTMRTEDQNELKAFIADEHHALHDAQERHRRDIASGVKY